jgi:hypothetical protein
MTSHGSRYAQPDPHLPLGIDRTFSPSKAGKVDPNQGLRLTIQDLEGVPNPNTSEGIFLARDGGQVGLVFQNYTAMDSCNLGLKFSGRRSKQSAIITWVTIRWSVGGGASLCILLFP